MKSHEVNFDGLVGPTHNYSGLSSGNLASMANNRQISNPREAALQGLAKMRLLVGLGLRQAVFPPHERPSMEHLRRLGFTGSDATILARAAKDAPFLLGSCSSASAMWTANAATVAPSTDTEDQKAHFTPANLVSKLHRSLESHTTALILRAVFPDSQCFVHHAPLPACEALGDEGAANHTRLAPSHGDKGLHLFVYGRTRDPKAAKTLRFPARQASEASACIARLHRLPEAQVVLAQQNPAAIDAGVFHNDVVAVGNENVFFFHEACFASQEQTVREMMTKWEVLSVRPMEWIEVAQAEVSLEDAVRSYLFNSQLVTLPGGQMALIAPQECLAVTSVKNYLKRLTSSGGPIREAHYPPVRQSMQNGGGPACLRLRVVLTEAEIARCNPGVLMDDGKLSALEAWVRKHYRDRLSPADLADPALLKESRTALDALTQLLGLGSIYPFQRV